MELPKILSKFDTDKVPATTAPAAPEPPERAAKFGPMTFAIALTINAVVSAILAVLVTLSFMRDDGREAAAPAPTIAREGPATAPASVAVASTGTPAPVEKVPARTEAPPERVAALEREVAAPKSPPAAETVTGFTVADTVELPFGKPGRLAFRLTPDTPRRERLLISFEGLPRGSGIYGLTRFGENIWRLEPSQSTEMLVIIPPDAPKSFSVKMALLRERGAPIERHTLRIVAKR